MLGIVGLTAFCIGFDQFERGSLTPITAHYKAKYRGILHPLLSESSNSLTTPLAFVRTFGLLEKFVQLASCLLPD